ncbi:hypothetical protein [Streptomyces blattellae]|uniref:hypothetical protein n=1 Tax=Streptomyces blattellae TaxID=2569855 RepID=UPI0012BA2F19|nr:hypothetical protein [Streptomyces blattellae]
MREFIDWLDEGDLDGKSRARYYAPGPLMDRVREEVRQSVEPYADPYRRKR